MLGVEGEDSENLLSRSPVHVSKRDRVDHKRQRSIGEEANPVIARRLLRGGGSSVCTEITGR